VKPEGLAFIQLQYTDSKGIWKPMEKHNIKVTVENGVLKGLGSPAPYVKGNYTDHTVATYYGEAMAVVQVDGNGPVKVTVADEERFYILGIFCLLPFIHDMRSCCQHFKIVCCQVCHINKTHT
jgi:beta-galactosidase